MPSDKSTDIALTRAEQAYQFWWHGPRRVLGWPLLVLGVVLLVIGLCWNDRIAQSCGELHYAMQLSGTTDRLKWVLDHCYTATMPPLRQVDKVDLLLADASLIIGFLLTFSLMLRAGWWRFEAEAMRKAWWVLYLPAVVALFDAIEDALLAWLLRSGKHLEFGPAWPTRWLLTTVAYTKWALVLAMIVAVVVAFAVTVSRWDERFPPPRRRPEADGSVTRATAAGVTTVETEDPGGKADGRRAVDQPDPKDDPELIPGGVVTAPSENEKGVVGVCVSGGGIRAAAFGLGVLRQLDGKARPLAKARYLSAVSGGAWAATAWTLRKAEHSNGNAADAVITALQHDAPSGYQRQKYLMNGPGGVLGPLGWVLLCAFVNLSFIGSLIYLIGWPLGWFQSRCAVSGNSLGDSSSCPQANDIPDTDVLFAPTVAFAIAGAAVLIVWGLGFRRFIAGWRIGALLLALSAVFGLYLIAAPWFFDKLENDELATIGSVIGTSTVITVGGGVWKLLGGPLVHEVTTLLGRVLPKLLGLVLALCAIILGLVVMYFSAKERLPASTLFIPIVWLLVLMFAFSPNWPTLHDIFSRRLRRSFDPHGGQPFNTSPDRPPDLPKPSKDVPGWTWSDLAQKTRSTQHPDKAVPELVLCCAQQRNGIAAGGLRAETFTVSPRWIRQGRRSTPIGEYLDAVKHVKLPFRKRFGLGHVSSWLATTGAAFSSAMGRSSLGSTNALLAAINADLGIWLPNMWLLQNPCRSTDSKLRRPKFGYLFKEILGLYSLHDRYIFVTDGGHWDNLGLVELLRRRCDTIYCIDGSGDPVGSFATLRQTLDLTTLELNEFQSNRIDLDGQLKELLPGSHALPMAKVTSLTLKRKQQSGPDRDVVIHYAKLQATQDMSPHLRRYAIADPKFPGYSTAQQFLSPQQFMNLVVAGDEAGRKLLDAANKRRHGGRDGQVSPGLGANLGSPSAKQVAKAPAKKVTNAPTDDRPST